MDNLFISLTLFCSKCPFSVPVRFQNRCVDLKCLYLPFLHPNLLKTFSTTMPAPAPIYTIQLIEPSLLFQCNACIMYILLGGLVTIENDILPLTTLSVILFPTITVHMQIRSYRPQTLSPPPPVETHCV